MTISDLTRLDENLIDIKPQDILCFVAVRNEAARMPHFLDYYRRLGVNRFIFADNGSTDRTIDYLLAQPDCHCFHTSGSYFEENVEPPGWTNTLANVFGCGHWCLTVDADELLIYPDYETVSLAQLCAYLDLTGDEALYCPMVDMYGEGPIAEATYSAGQPFLEACPYFDPRPGWIKRVDGACPEDQMFGGVRERAFWEGAIRKTLPPCISKVPLVKWRRGMKYLHSMHFHSGATISQLRGALLHFKFMTGMAENTLKSLQSNTEVEEKGLSERSAYLETLRREPLLRLKNAESVRFNGSAQLTELGWMTSTDDYKRYYSEVR